MEILLIHEFFSSWLKSWHLDNETPKIILIEICINKQNADQEKAQIPDMQLGSGSNLASYVSIERHILASVSSLLFQEKEV